MKTLITINEQDRQVAEFLKAANIGYSVTYRGVKKSDGWERDQFCVTFTNGKKSEVFEYGCGVGHRLQVLKNAYKLSDSQLSGVKKLRDLIGENRLDSTILDLGNKVYAVKPTQASVLYSLLLDANCADQNFDDFCSDLGYDPDSRKDFKIYEACCEILQKMRKIFTNTQRTELAEILQDY